MSNFKDYPWSQNEYSTHTSSPTLHKIQVQLHENGVTLVLIYPQSIDAGETLFIGDKEYLIVGDIGNLDCDISDTTTWPTKADGHSEFEYDEIITSLVTSLNSLFESPTQYVATFNKDISNWDVSNVTSMNNTFRRSSVFNQDLSYWNVSNVTKMSRTFSYAKSFNQDITQWDVRNVTDFTKMFFGNSIFDQKISQWYIHKNPDLTDMFKNATKFLKTYNTSSTPDYDFFNHTIITCSDTVTIIYGTKFDLELFNVSLHGFIGEVKIDYDFPFIGDDSETNIPRYGEYKFTINAQDDYGNYADTSTTLFVSPDVKYADIEYPILEVEDAFVELGSSVGVQNFTVHVTHSNYVVISYNVEDVFIPDAKGIYVLSFSARDIENGNATRIHALLEVVDTLDDELTTTNYDYILENLTDKDNLYSEFENEIEDMFSTGRDEVNTAENLTLFDGEDDYDIFDGEYNYSETNILGEFPVKVKDEVKTSETNYEKTLKIISEVKSKNMPSISESYDNEQTTQEDKTSSFRKKYMCMTHSVNNLSTNKTNLSSKQQLSLQIRTKGKSNPSSKNSKNITIYTKLLNNDYDEIKNLMYSIGLRKLNYHMNNMINSQLNKLDTYSIYDTYQSIVNDLTESEISSLSDVCP